VDPLLIKPSLPVPDDFDAFWAAQKAELAKVEMKAKLTPKQGSKNVEVFDVQVDCAGGKPVSGYYARPVGAKPKSCAAILTVHGAGVRSSSLGGPMGQANRGHISMDINAHGIPNGEPDDFYKKLADGELKDYRSAGREKRETVYFRGMFLRLVRAIDFLTAQPEWDGKVVIVTGGSQGGYQSIDAAGLDPRVTCIAAGVPAGCDHSGNVADRIAGWPKIVPLGKDGKPDPVILENARYYDAMNFATRFKGDAIFSVGFIDGTCPPTSVYAAYNNLNCRSKSIVNEPRMGHSSTPHIGDEFFKVMDAHIKRMHAGQ
jgi:cephalosporin-C deacetylase-like acetyl esterase